MTDNARHWIPLINRGRTATAVPSHPTTTVLTYLPFYLYMIIFYIIYTIYEFNIGTCNFYRIPMKYFNKLYKHICYSFIKRNMSSFKSSLWEDFMFVNSQQCDNEPKLMISMLVPINKSRKIHLCRSPDDTINTFIDRLSIKLSLSYGKKNIEKPKKSDISIKINGITVSPDSTCGEIFDENESNITLQIKDNIFKVIVNAPIINDLKLGIPPYKGLMLYPLAFEKGYNVSILHNKYLWYRVNSKEEIEVGTEMTYIPTENDVNHFLKLVCKPYNEKGQVGPTAEILSSLVQENNIEIYPFENRLKLKPNNR